MPCSLLWGVSFFLFPFFLAMNKSDRVKFELRGAICTSKNPSCLAAPPPATRGVFYFLKGQTMKPLIISLALVACIAATSTADEFDTSYCHDAVELQRWNDLRSDNPDSEPLEAIHALWIGLCVKVEARQLYHQPGQQAV